MSEPVMPFKDLLFVTFTYPDPTPERALRSGVALAARLGGALTLLAVRVDLPELHHRLANALIDLDSMAADGEARSAAAADAAAAWVSIAAKEASVEVAHLARTAKLYEEDLCMSAAARTRDLCLVAIGPAVTNDRSAAEAVLFESGRPVIVFPDSMEVLPAPHFGTVAIAWDGGAKAARAVADAMPLLVQASQVRILVVTGEKSTTQPGAALDLVRHLEAQGVSSVVDEASIDKRDIGRAIRDYVADRDVDLLVMGGFGHARAREFVLGGATRSMLEAPPCPILMSH
jgi:nucleotide-binding universal stress UspA family protein